ncbi:YqgQ family protein [Bacillus sp. RG28]|uniref:YqgQ family protein n=1 Tax=Gottfriedia endophytica TaxID=2820819 RepID=A0A940NL26_9BACI|nr:YqgQ family protein [Gottfriedia endophytica]MBP0724506.1 YqgQ family protein [Gottfriedia endophytica]
MKTVYDVQQLLKQFGTIIYTGDRKADLMLMHDELRELFQANVIAPIEFQSAALVIKREIGEIEKNERF